MMSNRPYTIRHLRLDVIQPATMMSIRIMSICHIARLPLQQLDSICYGNQECTMAFIAPLQLVKPGRTASNALRLQKIKYWKIFGSLNFWMVGQYPKIFVHKNYKFEIFFKKIFPFTVCSCLFLSCCCCNSVLVSVLNN